MIITFFDDKDWSLFKRTVTVIFLHDCCWHRPNVLSTNFFISFNYFLFFTIIVFNYLSVSFLFLFHFTLIVIFFCILFGEFYLFFHKFNFFFLFLFIFSFNLLFNFFISFLCLKKNQTELKKRRRCVTTEKVYVGMRFLVREPAYLQSASPQPSLAPTPGLEIYLTYCFHSLSTLAERYAHVPLERAERVHSQSWPYDPWRRGVSSFNSLSTRRCSIFTLPPVERWKLCGAILILREWKRLEMRESERS